MALPRLCPAVTRAGLTAALLASVHAMGACGSSKQNDCAALMGLINSGLEQLESSKQQQKNDPTKTVELRAMADALDQASTKASQLPLATSEVKAIAQRYQAMSKEVAKNTREVAEAHEKNDVARLTKAQAQLNDSLKLEDPIIDDLNKLCSQ